METTFIISVIEITILNPSPSLYQTFYLFSLIFCSVYRSQINTQSIQTLPNFKPAWVVRAIINETVPMAQHTPAKRKVLKKSPLLTTMS
jgi:hypothetical protein